MICDCTRILAKFVPAGIIFANIAKISGRDFAKCKHDMAFRLNSVSAAPCVRNRAHIVRTVKALSVIYAVLFVIPEDFQ